MAYGTKYRLPFTNNLGEDYEVQLNLKDFVGDAIELIGSGTTMDMQSFGSDDDRFTPVNSKGFTIKTWIKQTQNIGIVDFLATEDDQWQVKIVRDPLQPPVFEGFLLVEDSSEPFLDRPYELVIRASDGLPLLKNVPLKRSDGTDFTGYNSFTDYIGHILYYINPDIHFRVYYDIYHVSMDINECSLEQAGVDARTFEKDKNEFLDCYAALGLLMNDLECSCYYENGFWHIVSRWQYAKDYGFNWTEYNMVANAVTKVSSIQNDFHDCPIGKNENMLFKDKDATIYWKQHSRFVKLTFNYDVPQEVVCNQTLKEGTIIPGIGGVDWEARTIQCWEHMRWRSEFHPVNVAYIRREFDIYNYEKNTFVRLPTEVSATGSAHLQSSPFYIGKDDKVDVSVDTRIENAYGGGQNSLVFYLLLYGEDGTFWTLDDDGTYAPGEGIWAESNFNWAINRRAIQYVYSAGANKADWVTVSSHSSPAPVSGYINIMLAEHSFNNFPNATHFRNLSIDYHIHIRNSYAPVRGDYNLYEQNLKINKTIDETVSISDSGKKIIKGTIVLFDNTAATPQWFRTGFAESLRFTQIMALIKYSFNYRQFSKVEGTVKGLSLIDSSDNNIPFGFLPQYSLADVNQPTTRYILTSISEINYLTGHWRGILVEVRLNEVASFDKYDFSYIF